jgi:3-oxoacyl-[acyl-carrier protein] reductase
MDLQIKGKAGLVTGASSGIGRGTALALGKEGVRLALVARRRQLLEEVAAQIVAEGGSAPVIIDCDLTRVDAPAEIAGRALDGLGMVEILVNNAGGSRPRSSGKRRLPSTSPVSASSRSGCSRR